MGTSKAPDGSDGTRHWPPAGPVHQPELVRQGPAVGLHGESDGVPITGYGYTYVYGVSPTFVAESPLQADNLTPLRKIVPKKSWEIKSSMLGATPPRTARSDHQPCLDLYLIDGDPETCCGAREARRGRT